MKTKTVSKLSLLGVLLLSAPACWKGLSCDKKELTVQDAEDLNDGSEALVTVGGKTKLTVKSFEALLDSLAAENEQFKMMIQFMPDIKEQIFDAKKNAIVHSEWANNEGVADSDEFKKKYKMICDSVKDQLNHEFFTKSHKVEVSDTDAKKFYDENKDKDQRLAKSPAGTKAESITFTSKDAANAFKAKVTSANFDAAAKAENLTVKDLGLVTDSSFQIGSDAKKAILDAKAGTVLVAKDDKDYLVINVTAKAAAEYHEFDKVKDRLKQMLQGQKTEEAVQKATEDYSKKIGLKTNTKYFEDVKKQREAEAKQAAEAFAKSQQSAKPDAQAKELAGAKPVAKTAAPKVA